MMYTECPACRTVFRVTAKALQQASGRVRCGGCGRAFNALDFLSEDRPDTGSLKPGDRSPAGDAIAIDDELTASNRLLLKKLDELAGPDDVLIEDTGTEWRVLDSIFADAEGDSDDLQGSLDLEELQKASPDAWRFDDDTPHPDSGDKIDAAQPRVPQRRAEDLVDEHGVDAFDESQMDFALSEPGDWSELLDEFGPEHDTGDATENAARARQENDFEIDEELAAIHSELSAKESPADDIGGLRFELQEDATTQDTPAGESAVDRPDPAASTNSGSHSVETVILEGDSIHNSLDDQFPEPPLESLELPETPDTFDPAESLFAEDLPGQPIRGGRRSSDPAGFGVIAATVLLGLLLLGQVTHGYRQTLSTYELFNQTIGPLYQMLGRPVTPEWNIQGWQFEATNGNVANDDNVLTIFSRIGNKSELPLPYPLVHISLTDRWEEIVGSRVMAPNEYLAGDLDPHRLVRPGDNFTAVISVADPSADATGFKVNVCYPADPGRIRCATEDFKN